MDSTPPISAPVFPAPSLQGKQFAAFNLGTEHAIETNRVCAGVILILASLGVSSTADLPGTLWGRPNFWELLLKPINAVHG
jgi:hypothetical protein